MTTRRLSRRWWRTWFTAGAFSIATWSIPANAQEHPAAKNIDARTLMVQRDLDRQLNLTVEQRSKMFDIAFEARTGQKSASEVAAKIEAILDPKQKEIWNNAAGIGANPAPQPKPAPQPQPAPPSAPNQQPATKPEEFPIAAPSDERVGTGDIRLFAFDALPSGFEPCDGGELNRKSVGPLQALREQANPSTDPDKFWRPKTSPVMSSAHPSRDDASAIAAALSEPVNEAARLSQLAASTLAEAQRILKDAELWSENRAVGPGAIDDVFAKATGGVRLARSSLERVDSLRTSKSPGNPSADARQVVKLVVAMPAEIVEDIRPPPKRLRDIAASLGQLAQGDNDAVRKTKLEGYQKALTNLSPPLDDALKSLQELEKKVAATPYLDTIELKYAIGGRGVEDDIYLGEVRLFAFNLAPKGWARCDGSTIPIEKNLALFTLLRGRFGSSDQWSALPNIPPPLKLQPELRYYIATQGFSAEGRTPVQSGEYLGEIRLLPHTAAPKNFMECRGQAIPIDAHRELFKLLRTRFGGDGSNTFHLPNLPPIKAGKVVLRYYISLAGSFPTPEQ